MSDKLKKYCLSIVVFLVLSLMSIYFITNPKIYKKKSNRDKLVDSNYINLNNLNFKSNIITNIYSMSELKQKLSTNGVLKVTKNTKNVDNLSTGCLVTISFDKEEYKYRIALPGDINGDGSVNFLDITKLYKFTKNKIDLQDEEKIAANITGIDEEINFLDVTKLYKYTKNKVSIIKNETVTKDTINPEGIKVYGNIGTVVGKTTNMGASVYPFDSTNKNLTYTSSDSKIVTVDNNGNIKGIKQGIAKITIKSSNGKTLTKDVSVTPNEDEIHFININTHASGASTLIISDGHCSLIDAANNGKDNAPWKDEIDNGTKVVNYAKKLGCAKLDFIIATHSHSDHIGGMVEVAESSLVDENTTYYYKKYIETQEDVKLEQYKDWDTKGFYERSLNAIKKKGAKTVNLLSEDTNNRIAQGPTMRNLMFTFYNTYSSPKYVAEEDNRNSLGILIKKNNLKMFIAGDIGNLEATSTSEGDEDILARQIGDVDLFKVGHHGNQSSNSPNYLKALKPEYVIISNYQLGSDHFRPASAYLNGMKVGKNNDQTPKQYITGKNDLGVVAIIKTDSITIKKNTSSGYQTPVQFGISDHIDGWYGTSSRYYKYSYIKNGLLLKGWQEISGKWYYFDSNGVTVKGFNEITDSGVKRLYYFDTNTAFEKNSIMLTGWQTINEKLYYFYTTKGTHISGSTEEVNHVKGEAALGWVKLDNEWYYFYPSKGTHKIDYTKEEKHEKAEASSGWVQINNSWYYFNSDGIMQHDKNIGNYTLGSNGKCTNC